MLLMRGCTRSISWKIREMERSSSRRLLEASIIESGCEIDYNHELAGCRGSCTERNRG